MFKFAVPVIAASMIFSGAAMADGPDNKKNQNRPDRASSTSVSGGVAAAGPNGAVAGGVGASQADVQRQNRQQRRANRNGQVEVPSSAATSTTGAVFTNRRSGSAAINTNGATSGAGSVSSSSQGDVFSSTDRDGSEADASGSSDAQADEPKN